MPAAIAIPSCISWFEFWQFCFVKAADVCVSFSRLEDPSFLYSKVTKFEDIFLRVVVITTMRRDITVVSVYFREYVQCNDSSPNQSYAKIWIEFKIYDEINLCAVSFAFLSRCMVRLKRNFNSNVFTKFKQNSSQ